MTIELTTKRLLLRPLTMADAPLVETLIFGDAEVAKWLAHDISVPGNAAKFARAWCNELGIDGDNDIWSRGCYGAFAITDRAGEFAAPGSLLGIVGFYCADRIDGKWHGELFYALGADYHGRGIMSEACTRALDAYCKLPDAGSLYAVYWHNLNPASGRILRKLGFVEDGSRGAVEEYGLREVLSFYRFELWRIESANDADFERILREAAIKIGHLAFEGVVERGDALGEIRGAIARRSDDYRLVDEMEAAFERGMQGVGLQHLQFSLAA